MSYQQISVDRPEVHPKGALIRLARHIRAFRRFPFGTRLLNMLAAPATSGEFCVTNYLEGGSAICFSGDIGSFVDRQVYLTGGYEQLKLDAFLARARRGQCRTVLDIGCNAGTHSLVFAHTFAMVHSFEPNPLLWGQFISNIRLNGLENVNLHCCGLGSRDARLPFYLTTNSNFGLGTFISAEQYDLPLRKTCDAKVVHGDTYVVSHGLKEIDAVKIDVQGYEPFVLTGLQETLRRQRPLIWVEVGDGTHLTVESTDDLSNLLPEHYILERFASGLGWQGTTIRLVAVKRGKLLHADYLATPSELVSNSRY